MGRLLDMLRKRFGRPESRMPEPTGLSIDEARRRYRQALAAKEAIMHSPRPLGRLDNMYIGLLERDLEILQRIICSQPYEPESTK